MSCQSDTGKISDSPVSERKCPYTCWVLSAGFLGALALAVLTAWAIRSANAPSRDLDAFVQWIPYSVIAGPVDCNIGIPGVVAIGMSREEVVGVLGRPIVERIEGREAEKLGVIDPDDVDLDFFDGVFAWVRYSREDRVTTMKFDLREFARRTCGSQRVLLACGDHHLLLDRNLAQQDAVELLTEMGVHPRVQGPNVIVEDTGASLCFDSGQRLYAVWIIDR